MKTKFLKRLSCLLTALMTACALLVVMPVQLAFADLDGYYWPVPDSRTINQYYSGSHDGLDIGGTEGMTVCAVRSGTVVGAFTGDVEGKWYGYGNGVVIDHGNGYYSHYAHLNSYCVSTGQWVEQGQKIGELGNTGNSSGPHLHFAYATSMYGAGGRVNVNPDTFGYIYELLPVPSRPTLTITAGTSETETVLSWNACFNTDWYDIRFYHDSVGASMKDIFNYKDGTSYKIVLPAGNYYADVASVNSYGKYTFSTKVSFTVTEPPVKGQLLVTPDPAAGTTQFAWTLNGTAESLSLNITNLDTDEVLALTKKADQSTAAAALEDGNYRAVLNAVLASGSAVKLDTVDFLVGEKQAWTYCSVLPSDLDEGNVVQYKQTASKVAVQSPGEGWVKGDLAKTVYENSGDPYESRIELPTSETRVLVSYYYYHFCGGAMGNSANYEFTDQYSHYDSLSANNLIEAETGLDVADNNYRYYRLKWADSGAWAYCNSAYSCDGSNGTHGERTYVWYKCSTYQDKKPVDYYNYTYTGNTWSADNAAEGAVGIRFGAANVKTVTMLGDTDCNQEVDVSDAVLLARYLVEDKDAALTDQGLLNGDCNGSGAPDSDDVVLIVKHVAQLIDLTA